MTAQGQETRRKETKGKADNKINKTNDTLHTQCKYIYRYIITPSKHKST